MAQISLAIPDGMLAAAKKRAKAEGYRSVQEYLLQALRDKWFMDNLPRYERIYREAKEGKGYRMTAEEFAEYSDLIRKGDRKKVDEFLRTHPNHK